MKAFPSLGTGYDRESGASALRRTGWNGAVEAEDLFSDAQSSYWGHRFLRIFLWIMLAVGLAYGGWLGWSERGVMQGGDRRVVTPEPGPSKVKPRDPGGMVIPHLDKTVYQSFRPSRPLQKEALAVPPSVPAGAVASSVDEIPDHWTPVSAHEVSESGNPEPWVDEAVIDMSPDMLAAMASADPLGVAPPDRLPDEAVADEVRLLKEAQAEPIVSSPRAKAVEEKAAEKAEPSTATLAAAAATQPQAWVVQIGAYRSEAEAQSAWQDLRRRHGDRLTGVRPRIMRKATEERGIFYRLQLQSKAKVSPGESQGWEALCQSLALDRGRCFLVTSPVTKPVNEGKGP